MFNWVCPRCGKDVPPSKTECPNCGWRGAETPEVAGTDAPPPQVQSHGWQPPPPTPTRAAPPVNYAPPAPHPHAPPPPPVGYPPPPPSHWAPPSPRQTPAWLMGLLFALVFIGLFAGIYYGIQRFGRSNPSEKAGLENPANPSHEKVANPLQKYVEVVGIRLLAENKKPSAKFLVVNHSNAEVTDLSANVTLWASTSRSEEDSIGSFTFRLNSLPPNGSQEMTAPLKTKLRMYELPDWQNSTAEIQIVAP